MALLQMRLSLLELNVDFVLQSLSLKFEPPIPPYLRACANLLRQGRRQDAVDAYCETTGGGLAEANAAIAELTLLLRGACSQCRFSRVGTKKQLAALRSHFAAQNAAEAAEAAAPSFAGGSLNSVPPVVPSRRATEDS